MQSVTDKTNNYSDNKLNFDGLQSENLSRDYIDWLRANQNNPALISAINAKPIASEPTDGANILNNITGEDDEERLGNAMMALMDASPDTGIPMTLTGQEDKIIYAYKNNVFLHDLSKSKTTLISRPKGIVTGLALEGHILSIEIKQGPALITYRPSIKKFLESSEGTDV
jgi:hypothetical protein